MMQFVKRMVGRAGALTAVITLGAAGWPGIASAQTVVSGHPRLYLRPGDLTALRTRVTQAPTSTYYNQMRSRLDGAASRSSNDEVAGFELESLALLHLINGGTTYRDKILNTWRRTLVRAGSDHPLEPAVPGDGALLGARLPLERTDPGAAQRARDRIVAMMDDLYNYRRTTSLGANPMSDYSNQLYYHLGALAFAGGVLSGEGINDGRAAFYLSEAAMLLGRPHGPRDEPGGRRRRRHEQRPRGSRATAAGARTWVIST